jgi:CheY-like chemotaxis protein
VQEGDQMQRWRVLAVDDEPAVLSVIEKFLGSESCTVETAADAAIAWEKLNHPDSCFNFVILDHMMPGMQGLELLRRIKTDSRLQMLPVIMQSGAASPEEIAEGIEAGAFYFLTKPWAPNALRCIVRSVISDLTLRSEASARPAGAPDLLKHMVCAEFRFSTLEEVNYLAGALSSLCPDSDQAASGLVELLLNAVEHGNLGISYQQKKTLMVEDQWEAELRRRLALPEYAGRAASVRFRRCTDALEFRITDQGSGFDWVQYLEVDPERSEDPNGRGIAMARRYAFSSIEYQGTGNTVLATVVI